jgi:hypothetical protein
MRQTLLAGLIFLAGCQGVVGPAKRTTLQDSVDDPRYTIDEQKVRARDRVGLPDGSRAVGPATDADFNPFGRGR